MSDTSYSKDDNRLPLHYYNKPRLEGTAQNFEQALKNVNYPTWLIPRSFVEVAMFGSVLFGTYQLKRFPYLNFGPIKVGMLNSGVPRLVISMAIAMFGCRSVRYGFDRYDEKTRMYSEDYIKIYPHKFSHYEPKKLVDTFDRWFCVRSGGKVFTWTKSEEEKFGKREDPDHYMPVNNQQKVE